MKRTVSFLLALVMIVGALAVSTVTVSAATSGSCGKGVTWSYNASTHTLTISGSGKMSDYDYFGSFNQPWGIYFNDMTKVVINNGVTSIGRSAFRGMRKLTAVSIPSSVTFIGWYAFADCKSLASISIPDSVTNIEAYAFSYCESLTSVKYPKNATDIVYGAFQNCNKLKSVTLPTNLKSIGRFAFSGCESLSLTIPSTVDKIGGNAFADTPYVPARPAKDAIIYKDNCLLLVGVNAPKSLTVKSGTRLIADFAAYNSNGNVIIPKSVKAIGETAFGYFPVSITYQGSVADWLSIQFGNNNETLFDAVSFTGSLGADGWHNSSAGWYCIYDGTLLRNCHMADSTGKYCCIDARGIVVKNQLCFDGEHYYLADGNGYRVDGEGWHSITVDGKKEWYYLDINSTVSMGEWVMDSEDWCYLGWDGTMLNSTAVWFSDNMVLLDSNGHIVKTKGWNSLKVDGETCWYYVEGDNGELKTGGWMKDSKGWCYLDYDGKMETATYVWDSVGCCLVDENGYWMTKPGWHEVGGDWYYVENGGYLKTDSWMKDSKGWCYLNYGGRMLRSTTVEDTKGTCLLDINGYWVTSPGWHVIYGVSDDDWCYVQKDGYLKTDGWMKDSKGWCYLYGSGYMAANATVSDSKGICLVDESGYWVTKAGWYERYGVWYYVQKDGYLKTNGWMNDSKGWCYLGETGYMVRDTVIQDSNGWCYVDDSGYWVTAEGWRECEEYWPSKWAYVQKGGYLLTHSWKSDSHGKMYLDYNGLSIRGAVVWENEVYPRFIDKNGYVATEAGKYEANDYSDDVYCVKSDGCVALGEWVHDGYGYQYFGTDGIMLRNATCYSEASLYYVDSVGYRVTYEGWYTFERDWGTHKLHVNSDGKVDVRKWLYEEGQLRFVGDTGEVVKDTVVKKEEGKYVYFNLYGNWVDYESEWYFDYDTDLTSYTDLELTPGDYEIDSNGYLILVS